MTSADLPHQLIAFTLSSKFCMHLGFFGVFRLLVQHGQSPLQDGAGSGQNRSCPLVPPAEIYDELEQGREFHRQSIGGDPIFLLDGNEYVSDAAQPNYDGFVESIPLIAV